MKHRLNEIDSTSGCVGVAKVISNGRLCLILLRKLKLISTRIKVDICHCILLTRWYHL